MKASSTTTITYMVTAGVHGRIMMQWTLEIILCLFLFVCFVSLRVHFVSSLSRLVSNWPVRPGINVFWVI